MRNVRALSVKVVAKSAGDIEDLLKFLERRYIIVSRSAPLPNDRDGGFHVFASLLSKNSLTGGERT